MNMRSIAFGAALGIGGLAGIEIGAQALLDHAKAQPSADCDSVVTKNICSQLSQPLDTYIAVVTSTNNSGDGLPNSDVLLTGLGLFASVAGSLVLLRSASLQVAETLKPETNQATN